MAGNRAGVKEQEQSRLMVFGWKSRPIASLTICIFIAILVCGLVVAASIGLKHRAKDREAELVAAANKHAVDWIAKANSWIAEGNTEEDRLKITAELETALADLNVFDRQAIEQTLHLLDQHARSRHDWLAIQKLLEKREGRQALPLLEAYLRLPRVHNLVEAKWTWEELVIADSDAAIMETLLQMDEKSFQAAEASGQVVDPRLTKPETIAIHQAAVQRNLPAARARRAVLLADRLRREALIQQEQQRQAAAMEAAAEQAKLVARNRELRERLLRVRREQLDDELLRLIPDPTNLERFLNRGDFDGAELEFRTLLLAYPANDQLRFELALIQFFSSLQRLGQGLHRFGVGQTRTVPIIRIQDPRHLHPVSSLIIAFQYLREALVGLTPPQQVELPFLRLPVPRNPKPDAIDCASLRVLLNDFLTDLDEVDATLANIGPHEFSVSVHLGLTRFDMRNNGSLDVELRTILKQLHENEFAALKHNNLMLVDFDRGDAAWLRIYCQLMSAVLDLALAIDLKPYFEYYAPKLFPNPMVPNQVDRDDEDLELATKFGTVNIVEPHRFGRLRRRLLLAARLNYEMWFYIRAEKDNGLEWLPNAQQKSVLGFTISDPLVDRWLASVTELEATLSGDRVIPTGGEGFQINRPVQRGFNLKLFLEQPPEEGQDEIDFWTVLYSDQYQTPGVAVDYMKLLDVYHNYQEWFD